MPEQDARPIRELLVHEIRKKFLSHRRDAGLVTADFDRRTIRVLAPGLDDAPAAVTFEGLTDEWLRTCDPRSSAREIYQRVVRAEGGESREDEEGSQPTVHPASNPALSRSHPPGFLSMRSRFVVPVCLICTIAPSAQSQAGT